MDRNLILAVVLSVAVLIGFQYFFSKPAQQHPAEQAAPAQEGTDAQKAAAAPQATPPATQPAPSAKPAPKTVVEKEVVVETELYKAVLTNNGATFKRLELKKYADSEGNPIVLGSNAAMPPLAIGSDEEARFGGIVFTANISNITLDANRKEASLVFEGAAGDQIVRRTFVFHNGEYRIDLKDEVQGFPAYYITLGKEFGLYHKDDNHFGPVVLKDADRVEVDAHGLKETRVFKGGVKWIAQEDKYFFSALVPQTQIDEARIVNRNNDSISYIRTTAPVNQFMMYIGPKELETLEKYNVGLEHIVDFGWFSIIARPLFWILKFFNGFTHNYALAIILIAIVTRIPFIPLINKGQESMKKLAQIQPRMNEIREKYKNDPQRMQKETMELYKNNKVNPMGGCLPMLAQIPVFIALYNVLLKAIELRGAPFALWITDLSTKDPYYVLPIVMGTTTFLQQKMTPSTTADPMQQKMMLMMPVVFTFIFMSMPSGVVLYWTISNLFGIAQQFYMNQKAKQSAV
ncbi:MAG TPA: membrane protein insertase YidC [Dissulfurispiraceae bacterium]|nr:membrane protein insertase YidC [Dissulfurispiraceae bacterium]